MGNKGSSPNGNDRDAEEETQGGKTEATTKKPAKIAHRANTGGVCGAVQRDHSPTKGQSTT